MFAGKLRFLDGTPRSVWLSVAGGVSVAYVFVHLLPEVSEVQEVLADALGTTLGFLENHGYLLALVGLVVFYGLERAASASRKQRGGEHEATGEGVFWLNIGSFALYNLLIGYLLVRRPEQGLLELVWFAVAMALHFVVNDFGLREHHKDCLYPCRALGFRRGGAAGLARGASSVSFQKLHSRCRSLFWPGASSSTCLKRSYRRNVKVVFGPLRRARRSIRRCCC